MAHMQKGERLCSACKNLTFTLLRDGYKHPLTYEATVLSGKTCRLCRMIVCSMGKLQTYHTCYELEKLYDTVADTLPHLPAVTRYCIEGSGFPLAVEMLDVPLDVVWTRDQYSGKPSDCEWQVREGSFNDGDTIKITADKSLVRTFP